MNSDDISAPGVFPAYADVASGAAPFPDTPVLSSAPFIIPPPDAGMAADGACASIHVQFGTVTITQNRDSFELRRMIEEHERNRMQSLSYVLSSGTQ